MAWTAVDLAALETAYAAGALKVRFSDGREVDYPSGADLRARIETVKAELARAAEGLTAPARAGYVSFSRD